MGPPVKYIRRIGWFGVTGKYCIDLVSIEHLQHKRHDQAIHTTTGLTLTLMRGRREQL